MGRREVRVVPSFYAKRMRQVVGREKETQGRSPLYRDCSSIGARLSLEVVRCALVTGFETRVTETSHEDGPARGLGERH